MHKLKIIYVGELDKKFEKEDYGVISNLKLLGHNIIIIHTKKLKDRFSLAQDITINEENEIAEKIVNEIIETRHDLKGAELIFTHYMGFTCSISIFLGAKMKLPVIAMAHSSQLFKRRYSDIFWKTNSLNGVIAISNFNKEYIRKINPKTNVSTIYLGIDVSRFIPSGSIISEGKYTLLTVARLIPKKGIEYLLKAAEYFNKEDPRVEFKIIGDGILIDDIKQFISSKEIQNIRLCGKLDEKKIIQEYQNCFAFVLPSIIINENFIDNSKEIFDTEGIPVTLMEAMACEKPCISTNISGIPELIQNDIDGILIEEKNANEIVLMIKKVMGNENYYKMLSFNARQKIIKSFNINKNILLIEDFILHVLKNFKYQENARTIDTFFYGVKEIKKYSEVRNYYNHVWNEWKEISPFFTGENLDNTFKKFGIVKNEERLLDIGCGTGYFVNYSSSFVKSYGLDVSNVAIEKAKMLKHKGYLYIGCAEKMPFKSDFFDYITSFGTLEHVIDLHKSMLEIIRVSKNNAKILFYVPIKGHNLFTQKIERFASISDWSSFFNLYSTHLKKISVDDNYIEKYGHAIFSLKTIKSC